MPGGGTPSLMVLGDHLIPSSNKWCMEISLKSREMGVQETKGVQIGTKVSKWRQREVWVGNYTKGQGLDSMVGGREGEGPEGQEAEREWGGCVRRWADFCWSQEQGQDSLRGTLGGILVEIRTEELQVLIYVYLLKEDGEDFSQSPK
ncbi:uncharacterized protein EI90DRAFT_3016558 [Cantharellus anzutake]|uniref:uncharacterized protein n=1 Tax=Cantharellus anzutake TaxID=1750568 RepID=UPI0019073C70|nr:uncharacterized protein EI90DRAFT_3016558 [Cantharellus anzutake]KAF8331128.1 hypothetical protein EI90DRAFT_3016558 [Cantharellus anzutake]